MSENTDRTERMTGTPQTIPASLAHDFLKAVDTLCDWLNGNDMSADHAEQKPEDFKRLCESMKAIRAALKSPAQTMTGTPSKDRAEARGAKMLDATLTRWRSESFRNVMLAGAPGAWTAGEVAAAIDERFEEILETLKTLVAWHGKRGGPGDKLLPIECQDSDIADAMYVISKAERH